MSDSLFLFFLIFQFFLNPLCSYVFLTSLVQSTILNILAVWITAGPMAICFNHFRPLGYTQCCILIKLENYYNLYKKWDTKPWLHSPRESIICSSWFIKNFGKCSFRERNMALSFGLKHTHLRLLVFQLRSATLFL